MTKTARIAARISDKVLAQLDAIVAVNPGNRTDHIEQAIIEYIARHPLATSAPLAEPVEAEA